ncbi:anti-repressor SinI family protein [Virgibacillus oceani]
MKDVYTTELKKMDPEWITLVKQAKSLGLSAKEVQEFIRRKSTLSLQH